MEVAYGDVVKEYRERLGDKFTSRVVFGEEDECWPWVGGRELRRDRVYGRWRGQLVHREVYKAFVRPLFRGEWVGHSCGVTICVNYQHLTTTKDRWQQGSEENTRLAEARAEWWLAVSNR